MTILDNFKKLFKKEDYTFEVITSVPGVYEYGNVDLAKKIIPPWFKDLPNTLNAKFNFPKNYPFSDQKISTVKYCPSFQEIYTKGIIITAWCDMRFAIHPDGVVNILSSLPFGRDAGSHHLYLQRAGWMKNMTHYKIHSPYWFKTPQYRRFLWSGAYQHNEKLVNNNVYVITGIIDYFTQYASVLFTLRSSRLLLPNFFLLPLR